MADWDEIKRLAADFQRTQTSDTLQKISERNCIDIVKKLTDLNLIELIYTCDGKEFITPAHLTKEIEDEVYVNGGRMQLHDLAASLNVDYYHIETRAKELVKEKSHDYSLILGQIIHSTYKVTLSKQINDYMLTTGQLSIADYAKSIDLPSEFLLNIVKEVLPTIMDDFVVGHDERTFFTRDMMNRYTSIIAGTLSAITKPVNIASILKRLDIPERIFSPIVDALIKEGRIDAQIENRLYIPSVHSREQNEWIQKFYSSNSYIEYDVLSRMDIKQPKALLRKKFPDGIPLKSCFISPNLLSQVESLIEDCIASNSCIDIATIVPSAIETDDIEMLLQDIMKKNGQFASSSLIMRKTNICSLGFVAACKNSMRELMDSKAQEHLNDGKLLSYFLGCKPKTVKPVNNKELPTEPTNEEPEKTSEIDRRHEVQPDTEDENPPPGRGGKRERSDKKSKSEVPDDDDDDKEDSKQRFKGKRGAGGGTQGREIKQKAVKKKYIPGNKGGQRANDLADEETTSAKGTRSNKGRAARRALSPDRSSSQKNKGSNPRETSSVKEPLVFMTTHEMVRSLKGKSLNSEELSEGVHEAIAELIEAELNMIYEGIAKQALDEFLRSQEEEDGVEVRAECESPNNEIESQD